VLEYLRGDERGLKDAGWNADFCGMERVCVCVSLPARSYGGAPGDFCARFRDEIRSKNSLRKLATPEGNSQLGSNCPNSKAPENSARAPQ
jgi:hypothetical protein